MSDFGPASGNGTLNEGSAGVASVFVEVHSQNNFQSAASSGVPGGISGPASGLNNLGPGVFAGSTSAVATPPTLNAGATSTTGIYVNVQGTLPAPTSIIKNPA